MNALSDWWDRQTGWRNPRCKRCTHRWTTHRGYEKNSCFGSVPKCDCPKYKKLHEHSILPKLLGVKSPSTGR